MQRRAGDFARLDATILDYIEVHYERRFALAEGRLEFSWPNEAAEFERYLATSPEARQEVEEFRRTATVLAGAESAAPPRRSRRR